MSHFPNIAKGGLSRAATGIADAQAARRMDADRQAIAQKLMDMQGPSTITRSSVETLLAQQADAIVRLHAVVADLRSAISPVLRPCPPTDSDGRCLNPDCGSQMAQHIANDILGIETAIAEISEIRNRLDL